MIGNTFGTLFRATAFGESHGEGLGVVLEGVPSGIKVDWDLLNKALQRRAPGGTFVSSRKEPDIPRILSGVYEGKTLGTPIACVFENKDARSSDYKNLENRSGHADVVWEKKYLHVDKRGGGRSSGRETLARVVAGSFAQMALKREFPKIKVKAITSEIYNLKESRFSDEEFFDQKQTELGFLTQELSTRAEALLLKAKEEGESYGGLVEVRVQNPPEALGQPVFDKLKSKLASAALSIGAVNSFMLGERNSFDKIKGTEFHNGNRSVYGGIQGGISTGETIRFFSEVKPTSSILDVSKRGRHDPCIVPRVLVVLESMVWTVLYDFWLLRKVEIGK